MRGQYQYIFRQRHFIFYQANHRASPDLGARNIFQTAEGSNHNLFRVAGSFIQPFVEIIEKRLQQICQAAVWIGTGCPPSFLPFALPPIKSDGKLC